MTNWSPKNWNDIFDLFVGKNDDVKDWMKRPFINFDGNVWATDGHAAIIVDPCICRITAPVDHHKTEIPELVEPDKWLFVGYGDLQHAVDMCGTEEVMKETKVVCPLCDGTGELHNDKTKIRWPHPYKRSIIDLCGVCFDQGLMMRVVKALRLMGFESMVWRHKEKEKGNIFKVCEGVRVLIMPISKSIKGFDDGMITETIKY